MHAHIYVSRLIDGLMGVRGLPGTRYFRLDVVLGGCASFLVRGHKCVFSCSHIDQSQTRLFLHGKKTMRPMDDAGCYYLLVDDTSRISAVTL